VAWVLHQHRSAYNLAGGPYDDLSDQPFGRDVRALIERTDQQFLPECRAVFANSSTVADRLRRYSGVDAQPLLHPPPLADQLSPGPPGDHILCVGRVEVVKRQNLLIAAMEHVKAPVRLVLAGANTDEHWTREVIERHDVGDRVDLLGFVDEKELLELYATALAVAYVPVDEDLGYVTLQAMAAGRPVITTNDSGGAASFVVDGTTGHVVDAEVFALARAIDAIAADRARAASMGDAGRDAYDALDLSWPGVVQRLIDAASS
jgi:glycosyltransferase involved in cell wall biosynthesis